MSVQELKEHLIALSPEQRAELAAFLFQLRRKSDATYQTAIQRRIDDKDPSHWLTPDEFESRLNEN